jgi:carbon-monoxide dehydrogenase large subunit
MEGMAVQREGIGQPVRRKEDARLVTGRGRFSDDLNLPGQAYAVVVRSPHAHAWIGRVDSTAASTLPGVIAVITGADVKRAALNSIAPDHILMGPPEIRRRAPDIFPENRDGSAWYTSPHLPLPADRARFVGEPVAMVVAETIAIAKDAAERVVVDYEPLDVVTTGVGAVEPDAPLLWAERNSNVGFDADAGSIAETAAAFARASRIVRLRTWIQRVTGVPMEPRAAVGDYDAATGRYTLYAGSGGIQRQRREVASILGVSQDLVRVVAQDIGGNFGTKNGLFPEYPLVVFAARRVGRPVKWTCDRSEAFLSDYHGRDLYVEAELALDKNGNFLAIRGSNVSNVGAHTASYVAIWKGMSLMSGNYHIPAGLFRGRAATTNTMSTAPYRSAGRPEAIFVIERLVDIAARECGTDRVELRRRNLVQAGEMPYRNPMGVTYEDGDYAQVMERALELGDWDGFSKRRAEARRRGRLRGIGVANYVEITSGVPRERAEITIFPEGRVELMIGALSSGQGHETSFAQCVVEVLGVPIESIQLIEGDTDRVPVGGGSHSGRSMRMGCVIIDRASKEIVAKGRRIAAVMLEAAEIDIAFAQGRYTVKGTDRSVGLFEVAAAARARTDLPDELGGPLGGVCDEVFKVASFPFGSHVCEVEIDPETGAVELARYTAVDDVGRAVNPLILHGQTHGGIAQGIGQALLEQCHYDPETGQLLTASFMDYAMPRADMLPSFVTEISEIPSTTNPLGVRSGGEGGTTPALAVVVNAIVDALAEFGVTHVEMPTTSERLWRTISAARSSAVDAGSLRGATSRDRVDRRAPQST